MNVGDGYFCEAGYVLAARDLGLSGADFLAGLSPYEIRAAYNGVGPEWLDGRARGKLCMWFSQFVVCCVIHDCRFAYDNDGTYAKFRNANDELERNCVAVADARYAWYNPLRYWARGKGRFMAEMCREFGWRSWLDARAAQVPGKTGAETGSFLDQIPAE